MKLFVYEIVKDSSRKCVWTDFAFSANNATSASEIVKAAVDVALKEVILSYFPDGCGISYSRIGVGSGTLRQRIDCSGRNVKLKVVDGTLRPTEDRSVPDRAFDLEIILDAGSSMATAITDIVIQRLKVRNYRSVEKFEREFSNHDGLILLAGLNGTGKTSILEAIAHAFLWREEIRPLPAQPFEIDIDFTDGSGRLFHIERKPRVHRLLDAKGNLLADTEYELRRRFSSVNMGFVTSWRRPLLVSSVRLSVNGVSSRRKESPLPDLKKSCIDEYVMTRLNGVSAGSGCLARLNAAWAHFYPEENGVFHVGQIGSASTFNAGGELMFDLFLKRSPDGADIPVDELSSGEMELLSFISMLVARKKPYGVILIDELELHLNRVWHETVLAVLRELGRGTQFFITTHSPEILRSAYSWQRIVLGDSDSFAHPTEGCDGEQEGV